MVDAVNGLVDGFEQLARCSASSSESRASSEAMRMIVSSSWSF
jgi:hypothetical protein